MEKRRLLVIGLDGFELSLAERLIVEGRMKHLKRLRHRSARFLLDHGTAKYTGLAWEHVSTARTPEALGRHSAVSFDPARYHVSQDPTRHTPVFAHLTSRCVLFDVPYCDLVRSTNLRGVAHWGAHDPGVAAACRPASLAREMAERFGPYPAEDHIYAMVWQSAERTQRAGAALTEAVRRRAAAAEWLLGERLPDWDLGMVVVSEPHSASEPFWHGVDDDHPYRAIASAAPAREALESVYEATDALIGRLCRRFPDAAIAVFSMHGMGSNGADVAATALLPELLYRQRFGLPYMRELPWAQTLDDGTPLLGEGENWHRALVDRVPNLNEQSVQSYVESRSGREDAPLIPESIDWQPAARYRPFWPEMEAFALPSFYDGRVRINLAARERYGIVSPGDYPAAVARIGALLHDCRDPVTGDAVIESIREADAPPGERGRTEADLYVYWRGIPRGFVHPELGTIGPLALRRTGGHSGKHGFLYIKGPEFDAGRRGMASSFDVVPTLLDLLGEQTNAQPISGDSLLDRVLGSHPLKSLSDPAHSAERWPLSDRQTT